MNFSKKKDSEKIVFKFYMHIRGKLVSNFLVETFDPFFFVGQK
jgi:hypothetical protein